MAIKQTIEFLMPIKESISNDKEFLIKGTAINETTTRNGVRYVAEELEKSSASLRNKPILKDHINSVDSIVGRTTDNVNFNSESKSIGFEARIMDKDVQAMISDGRIQSVSIGAMVESLEESTEEDGDDFITARGIDFVELSLVAVPADPNAGFAKAICESLKTKEVKSEGTEDKTMSETKKDTLEELKATTAKLQEEIESMKIKNLEEQKKVLEQEGEAPAEEPAAEPEKEAEAPAEEPAPEAPSDETQGEVGEPEAKEEKVETSYTLERSNLGGWAFGQDYSTMEGLNRLRR